MTFLELTRKYNGIKVRVNMDHVSEYFANEEGTMLVYENGKALTVEQTPEHIDVKIRAIEEWRMNAKNRVKL